MADDLRDILATARAALHDVPDEVWQRFEAAIRGTHGGRRIYIPAPSRKQTRLQAIADAGATADAADLSRKLGISVRHVMRLKKLVE